MLNKLSLIWIGFIFIILMGLLSCNQNRNIDMKKRNKILFPTKDNSRKSYDVFLTQAIDDQRWIILLKIYFNRAKPTIEQSLIYNQSTQSFLILGSGQNSDDSKRVGKAECLDPDCRSLKGVISLNEISSVFEDNEKNRIDFIFQRSLKKVKLTIFDENERELESFDNLSLYINGYKDIEGGFLIQKYEFIGNSKSNYSTIFYITNGPLYSSLHNDVLETIYLRNISLKSFLSIESRLILELIPCKTEAASPSNIKCAKFTARDPDTLTKKNYFAQFSEGEGL